MPKKTQRKLCSVKGCSRGAVCKGLCMRCYGRVNSPPKTGAVRNRKSLLAEYPSEWSVLNSMRARCYNPKSPSYKNYGARGITICDRWLGKNGLENFINDMGRRPEGYTANGRPLYSIDRIDHNDNYCPENCKWATIWEQNQHTSRNQENVGVYHRGRRWKAELTVNHHTYHKWFDTEEEAKTYRKYLENRFSS